MGKGTSPALSVVMPVHNARPFLDESIRSIVEQSFSDFEFVMLDDASTDGSERLLQQWEKRDGRIRLIRSEKKLGLSGSSNFVVAEAATDVVARMDADDVSHPDRLRRQFAIIRDSPDVVAVGALCDGINAQGRLVRPRDRWRLVRRSPYVPFPHGSAMFRKSAFHAVNGYSDAYYAGEDQNFFFKMTAIGLVVTLPEVLYHYRYHSENATLRSAGIGVRSVAQKHSQNGENLAAFYMLGAMRLWSGQSPGVLSEILSDKSFKWNVATLTALGSAGLGTVSPASLRVVLRSLIRTRDLIAGLWVKDGRHYEWRLK